MLEYDRLLHVPCATVSTNHLETIHSPTNVESSFQNLHAMTTERSVRYSESTKQVLELAGKAYQIFCRLMYAVAIDVFRKNNVIQFSSFTIENHQYQILTFQRYLTYKTDPYVSKIKKYLLLI